MFHADGTLAAGPIALCEVQGYVYAAKRGARSSCDAEASRLETPVQRPSHVRLNLAVQRHGVSRDLITPEIELRIPGIACQRGSRLPGSSLASQQGLFLGLGNSHRGQR